MKRKIVLIALVVIAGGFSAANENTMPTSAQPADTYTIDWYSINSGGAMNVSGGTYTLGGTIGQANAGSLSGGSYTLIGGFWNGLATTNITKVYLPIILR